MKFCEYEFLDFCQEKYLNGYCNQEEAITLQELDMVSEKTKDVGSWQLTVWLGEFLTSNSLNPSQTGE